MGKYAKEAELFKALGDENRLFILNMLRHGELCACKILEAMGISQSTLSHHMKILCATGLVKGRKEGKWVHYSIDTEVREACLQRFAALTEAQEHTFETMRERPAEITDKGDMKIMNKKIKLYILTGFLGAGKTTMLVNLLDKIGKTRKIGIIQNEFGKLDIDGDILRRGDIEMIEIGRGSIFCSCLKSNFVEALEDMSRENLDCLFVESSGLADPSNLQSILQEVEKNCGGQPYDLAGTICLIDGVDFMKDAAELETVERQVVHCNIALLNKRDLIDEARAAEVTAAIQKLNDRCLIVETIDGVIEPALLERDLTAFEWAENEETTNTAETKPKTFSIEFEGSVEKEKLTAFLQAVLPDAYRIKGFCVVGGAWHQVDVVGDRIDYKPCEDMGISRMVFISRTGIQLIRKINDSWKAIVDQPVKLKN